MHALLVFLLLAASAASALNPIAQYFESIRADTVWPVVGTSAADMSSTFGPRVRASCGCYDFHRGIDIHANIGDDIIAPYDAQFYDVQTYNDGGLTVRLRHVLSPAISHNGKTIRYYYTYYMHMDSVDPALAALSKYAAVPKGTKLGEVGISGSALAPHLHWEIRMGSICSLEYQLSNPGSSCSTCSGCGFDPHYHPLLMFPPDASNLMSLTLITTPTNAVDGLARVETPHNQTLLNRVVFTITRKGKLIKSHTLDLNERTGFDASTTATLDTPDTTKPYFQPVSFGYSSGDYATEIVLPASYVAGCTAASYKRRLVVTDIWERSQIVTW
eukprot:m.8122 g.8122  ORF g.8122 m.8122 type:complete len:330 (+) comp5027_c0_seq2:225-1214(+)